MNAKRLTRASSQISTRSDNYLFLDPPAVSHHSGPCPTSPMPAAASGPGSECRPQIGPRRRRGLLPPRLGLGLDPVLYVLVIPLLPLERGLGVPVDCGCVDRRRHFAAAACFNAISHGDFQLLACGQGFGAVIQPTAPARTIPWCRQWARPEPKPRGGAPRPTDGLLATPRQPEPQKKRPTPNSSTRTTTITSKPIRLKPPPPYFPLR
jgi:hypothetical protein